MLKEEVSVSMEEARKELIEGLSRNVQTHKINSDKASTEVILS